MAQLSPSSRLRLALADDRADVLEEMRRLLEPDFQIVCQAREGAELLAAVAEARPDGVVSDFQMPGMDGIAASREILCRGLCGAIVTLSMYADGSLVRRALESGIRGYVLKIDAGEELIPALHAVLAGRQYLSRGVHRFSQNFPDA